MVLEDYANLLMMITTVSGSIMSLVYLPQIYKIWKRKSVEDISIVFFLILFVGMIIWLMYGLSINNIPLIAANIISIIGTGVIIFLYFRYKR